MKTKLLFFLFSVLYVNVLFSQKIPKTKTILFIGTYTAGKPDSGIYVYEFNSISGILKQLATGNNLVNPSFLAISPNGKYLYACTESKLPQKGNVSAFKIDSVSGKISFINKQSCGGENPVYLTIDNTNNFVIDGNYTEGNVTVFKTNADGSINPYSQIIQFTDSSINKMRQDKAHIHSTVFSPKNDFIYFPDLGGDKIRAFKFDTSNIKPLSNADKYIVKTSLGGGPRHFTFHPNGKYAYCIEELSGIVAAYNYSDGKLDTLQRIFSYSKIQETYGSSDIHVSQDGLFLYASNRWENENTISIFSIDKNNGKLKLVGHQSTFGDHPRMFAIDPSGKFLLVANLVTNNIVVFKRDSKTGLLTKTKYEISVPRPSCLQMRTYNQND
jgi:6-phosphogluconolactonase